MNINSIVKEEIDKFLLKEIVQTDMTLYHGTPHDFIRFQTKNIGTGEGSQCFGYGLYFTENKSVAEFYANMLKRPLGYVYTVSVKNGEFFEWYKRLDNTFKANFINKMHELGYNEMPYKRMLEAGKIKTYSLPVEEAADYFPNGKFFYENMSLLLGGQKEASAFLYQLGFAGIKYPVGSFLKDKISDVYGYNYVIFNGDTVKIIDKKIIK